jgi:hypothetical protein
MTLTKHDHFTPRFGEKEHEKTKTENTKHAFAMYYGHA